MRLPLLAGVIVWVATAAAVAAPPRVVSLDLCSDQFVLALADPGQIAAVSKVADDPQLSPYAARAAGVRRHRGTAEEVLAQGADLAIGGGFARRATLDMLGRVGVRVVRVPPVLRLADLPPQLDRVGAAIGQADRGRVAAAELRRALDRASPPAAGQATVGVYRPNGSMPGDASFVADMVRAAGHRLLDVGRGASVAVPLEVLALRPPQVLLIDSRRDDRPALSQTIFDHPVLRPRPGTMAQGEFPLRYWLCNSPASTEGVEVLSAEIARALPERRP